MADGATRPPPVQHEKHEKFRKGVAISVWQNSADEGVSNWTRYAYSKWPFPSLGVGLSATRGKYKVGKSCDFWNRWEPKELGWVQKAGSLCSHACSDLPAFDFPG